jgi:hypothetical protein
MLSLVVTKFKMLNYFAIFYAREYVQLANTCSLLWVIVGVVIVIYT